MIHPAITSPEEIAINKRFLHLIAYMIRSRALIPLQPTFDLIRDFLLKVRVHPIIDAAYIMPPTNPIEINLFDLLCHTA
jgi:hypothetical protein